jgi:hypothetical protein
MAAKESENEERSLRFPKTYLKDSGISAIKVWEGPGGLGWHYGTFMQDYRLIVGISRSL